MATKWKPLGGTEWLQQPDWALQEKLPRSRPIMLGHGNGRPELKPYRYQGSDHTLPEEATVTIAARRRPKVREATALDDPYLRYAACPVSRPPGWGDQ